ncbi:hypothetical protein OG756_22440 [Streptomyces sp. NBC_01310]|nr:hypothetical protein OG756_22440 [Streptomyces sp. NBC_01310]
MTQRALAEEGPIDIATLASIEQGRRVLMPDVAERLDRLGLPGVLKVATKRMPEVDTVPDLGRRVMERKPEAVALSWYDTQMLARLLQTEHHALAGSSDAEARLQTGMRSKPRWLRAWPVSRSWRELSRRPSAS